MSARTLVRLPRAPSTPQGRDARAKEEYFVSRVLNEALGQTIDVAHCPSVTMLGAVQQQAPRIAFLLEKIGNYPIVVNVKSCSTGVPFRRQIAEQYKTDIDVIVERLVPRVRACFLDPDDAMATAMIRRVLLRVSPWLIDPCMNALGLFKALLPECEVPELLAGRCAHRVKPEYRVVRSA